MRFLVLEWSILSGRGLVPPLAIYTTQVLLWYSQVLNEQYHSNISTNPYGYLPRHRAAVSNLYAQSWFLLMDEDFLAGDLNHP